MSPHLQGLLIALAIGAVVVAGYAADHPVQRSNSTMHTDGPVPNAASFTSAPLRNRIRVELKAPVPNVWALMGDLTRYPEYSSGLERVEVKKDSSGMLTEYVCRFKPQEEGGESVLHRELMRWYQPNRGYASISEGAQRLRAHELPHSGDARAVERGRHHDVGAVLRRRRPRHE